MKRIIFLVSFMFILLPINALATSGSLKKDSIKECEGTLYGTHGSDNHYHIAIKSENGSYVASGEAIYTDPCPIKQDDNEDDNTDNKDDDLISDSSLKEIKINGDSINISDTMEYTTTSDVANLEVKANSESAKVEYENITNLNMGNNIVNIKVTNGNSNTKYVLIIVREKSLSDNKNIVIKIDGEEVNFDNYKYNIEVKNDVKSLNIDYILEDKNAHVDILDNENFVVGKNDVKIIVTAEDGSSLEYTIRVTKLDLINSIIKIILGSSIVVSIIAIFKKIFKH